LIQCPVCQARYITNTIYCTECGAYLLDEEKLKTDPIELAKIRWLGNTRDIPIKDIDLPSARPTTVCLIIGTGRRQRKLELSLVKPARLGRKDPTQNVFPEVDLTDDLAMECGVSREHASIFVRGGDVMVEDLGSTNGTLLNGVRLDPYMPEILNRGDQLQLGRLLIEVRLE
jgi:hypothetical protein